MLSTDLFLGGDAFPEMLTTPLAHYLTEKGIGKSFVRDFAGAAMACNYGQRVEVAQEQGFFLEKNLDQTFPYPGHARFRRFGFPGRYSTRAVEN